MPPRIIRELRLGLVFHRSTSISLMRVDGPARGVLPRLHNPPPYGRVIGWVCRASLMAAEVQVRGRHNPTCRGGDWVLTHLPAAAMPKLEGRIATRRLLTTKGTARPRGYCRRLTH